MSTTVSRHTAPAARPAVPLVGRLVPVDGIVLRAHPDRRFLDRVLDELAMPLAFAAEFAALADQPAMPPAAREALGAVAENIRHAGELVADYREFLRLEADLVRPEPADTPLVPWFDGLRESLRGHAEAGGGLQFRHRSFLPDRLQFDAALAAMAVDAVARTALHRAAPGPLVVQTSCRVAGEGAAAELCVELATRGGGFGEVELGYAFSPFSATDHAQRPLLGLSVAHRLCALLGGSLTIESPRASNCTYTLKFAARVAPGALWVDPLAGPERALGAVRPGTVVLAEPGRDHQLLLGPPLRRAGHALEFAADTAELLSRLARCPEAAAVVAAELVAPGPEPFCARIHAAGHRGRLVVFGGTAPATLPSGCDAWVPAPVHAAALLAALTPAGVALTPPGT